MTQIDCLCYRYFFKKSTSLKVKKTWCVVIVFLSLLFMTTFAYARDVTFAWTASTDSVDGYKIYYVKSIENDGPPYDGTGAVEGNSPIFTGNVTSFTIHDLSDTEEYDFFLTAIKGSAESEYSHLGVKIKSMRLR